MEETLNLNPEENISEALAISEEKNPATQQNFKPAQAIVLLPEVDFNPAFKIGDPVIVFETKDHKKLIFLSEGGILNNRYGSFPHSSFVGKKPGAKIAASKNTGFVYILRASPVLVTETLSHKTQIIYAMDISMIIMKLNFLPGSLVVESGTGSGSLSYSLANTVQSEGHLFTFEFNLDRVQNAKKVFSLLGLNNVSVFHRDVLGLGFLPQPEDEPYDIKERCDAVFLDLPKPWVGVFHAKQVLKRGGKICCFSPCIEQVQKNCEELKNQGFVSIETIETLCRNFERHNRKLNVERQKEDVGKEDLNKKRSHVESKSYMTSGPQHTKGHTAYLTFATLH